MPIWLSLEHVETNFAVKMAMLVTTTKTQLVWGQPAQLSSNTMFAVPKSHIDRMWQH